MHQRLPILRARHRRRDRAARFPPNQEAFDRASARHTPSEQPRGKHTRIVDDDDIAFAKGQREIVNRAVDDAAGAAIELEQPCPAALLGRFLGDQFGREIEVELANVHVRECTPAGSVNQ